MAVYDWLYLTLMRLERNNEADSVLGLVPEAPEIVENDSYLKRLYMYKGELSVDSLKGNELEGDVLLALSTQGYGIANYLLIQGDTLAARSELKDLLSLKNWPAFGHIAAEADLNRGF